MTVEVKISSNDIQVEKIKESSSKLKDQNLILEAEYIPVSPLLIGDFTGETYKLVKDPNKNTFIGAYLTGIPTAQQIIGKARWLMRVAIATATDAKNHKEAEEKPIIITIKKNKKKVSLGPVEFAFGNAEKNWKGILSVEVEVSGTLYNKFEEGISNRTDQDIQDIIMEAIIKARKYFIDETFFRFKEVWTIKKRGKYYFNSGKIISHNRFNTLLAVGSAIREYPETTFVQVREGSYFLKEPVKIREEPGHLLRFKLKIYKDIYRLSHIINLSKNSEDLIEQTINLAIFSILAVPFLLGVGGSVNRGFGRFKPIIQKQQFERWQKLINDPILIIYQLYQIAQNIARHKKILKSDLILQLHKASIPLLPVDELQAFAKTINIIEEMKLRHKIRINDYDKLGVISFSASKINWKKALKTHPHSSGKYIHTWPLGLPRSAGKGSNRIGYLIRRDNTLWEGRRQSFISSFYIGDAIYVIGFPSGDILRNILQKLVFKSRSKQRVKEEDVQNLMKRVAIVRYRRYEDFEDVYKKPEKYKEFLWFTFDNYVYVLESSLRSLKHERR